MSALRVILLKRDADDRVERAAREIGSFLEKQPQIDLLASVVVEDLSTECLDGADLIVVLGGDGAILRACRKLGSFQRPLLGVNLGRLGFLADLTARDFRERFDEIRNHKYDVVEHLMFECTLRRADGTSENFLGLNEAAVSAASTLEMIEVCLTIDDAPVTTYSCDGLIISTPIGSTAHSLSAGGPAIQQDLPVFVVTPICPHTLSNRALVDDADRTYRLTLPSTRTEVMVVIDGQIRRSFGVGDEIVIRRADVTCQLARMPGHNYYKVLQDKMGWSGQPRYNGDDE